MTTPFPAQLKVVFSPPDDTDPPTDPIETTDNLLGISPPAVVIQDLPTPSKYGTVGDGEADDTEALQDWLDAIGGTQGYLPAGTYLISGQLLIASGTTIWGSGRGTTIIKKSSDFPASLGMIRNENIPGVVGAYSDSDLAFYGVCFDGSSITSNNAMMNLLGVSGVTIRDCRFKANRYFEVALSGCTICNVTGNHFTDWGRTTFSDAAGSGLREGGVALWIGSGTNGASTEIVVENNWFLAGEWGGIQTDAEGITIAGNYFQTLKEYGIRGTPTRARIYGNSFRGITTNDIWNYGVALSGTHISVGPNTFDQIGGDAIRFTDVTLGKIFGNTISRPQSQGTSGNLGAGIHLVSVTTNTSLVTIQKNTVNDSTGVCGFGILFTNLGATPQTDVLCENNQLPGVWGVSAIGFASDFATDIGSRCMVRNNQGGESQDWQTNTVTFLIPSGTEGLIQIGGVGFKPRQIEFHAVSATVVGTATASLGVAGWQTVWDIDTLTVTSGRAIGPGTSICWATDGTDVISGPGNNCVRILEADETDVCVATLTSIEVNGFILDVDPVSTADVWVSAVCHA